MVTKYFDVPFANTGDKTSIPDASQPSGSVSFEDGYTPDYAKDQATDPDAKDVPRQSENYFKFTVTEALKEIQERGFKPYDALVNYPVGAIIPGSDNTLYGCTVKNGPDPTFLPVVDPVGDVTGTWKKVGMNPALTTFSVSGSYSKPDGLKFIEVTVIGGGGGGGGVATVNGANGVGGGGGGAAKSIILADDLAASEIITIGAGGAGGTNLGGDGGDGGTSSLGAHCIATGGIGGLGAVIAGKKTGSPGGEGTVGDLIFTGQGSEPVDSSGDYSSGGGSSILGGGGKGVVSTASENGGFVGGGGGGAIRSAAADRAGGAGRRGVIIIKEFF